MNITVNKVMYHWNTSVMAPKSMSNWIKSYREKSFTPILNKNENKNISSGRNYSRCFTLFKTLFGTPKSVSLAIFSGLLSGSRDSTLFKVMSKRGGIASHILKIELLRGRSSRSFIPPKVYMHLVWREKQKITAWVKSWILQAVNQGCLICVLPGLPAS